MADETEKQAAPEKPAPAPKPQVPSDTIIYAGGTALLVGQKVAVSYDPAAAAPDGATLKVVGLDLRQIGFSGFSEVEGFVCVGPAHPVYVAANLAFMAGVKQLTVKGLPDDSPPSGEGEDAKPGSNQRERLAVFFDQVANLMKVEFA
jgi:hypothetical protein